MRLRRIIPTAWKWIQIQHQSLLMTNTREKKRLYLKCALLMVVLATSFLFLTIIQKYLGSIETFHSLEYNYSSNNFFNGNSNNNNTSSAIILLSTDNNGNCTNPIASIVPKDFGTNIQLHTNYKGILGVNRMCSSLFAHELCNRMPEQNSDRTKNSNNTIYNVSFSCDDLFHAAQSAGTGNIMMTFYSLRRMAQQIGNIDVTITCNDANATKDKLILPWLMGSFPRTYWYNQSDGNNNKLFQSSSNPLCEYMHYPVVSASSCKSYNPMDMYQDIIFELRRMAIALVGTLDEHHPAHAWAENNLWQMNDTLVHFKNSQMQLTTPQKSDQPILSNIEIDDVAFHFRCGDIITTKNKNYGFMKFRSYSKRLESKQQEKTQFRSIGIVTQPFSGSSQVRQNDKSHRIDDKCHTVLYAFKHFLEEQNYTYVIFDKNGSTQVEKVRVSIRNNEEEFITTAYARLIMAKHVVVTGKSSFARFAALASFSKEIYMRHDTQNTFAELMPSIHQTKEPIITTVECQQLWDKSNDETVIQRLSS
jgi:hypothetical protein